MTVLRHVLVLAAVRPDPSRNLAPPGLRPSVSLSPERKLTNSHVASPPSGASNAVMGPPPQVKTRWARGSLQLGGWCAPGQALFAHRGSRTQAAAALWRLGRLNSDLKAKRDPSSLRSQHIELSAVPSNSLFRLFCPFLPRYLFPLLLAN